MGGVQKEERAIFGILGKARRDLEGVTDGESTDIEIEIPTQIFSANY